MIVQAKNISKIYNGSSSPTKAVDDISLFIKKGEYVSITGKSGSGKSTLLYLLSLLEPVTSGEILIDDKSVLRLSEKKKTIIRLSRFGFVFQQYALLPELSAVENVMLPALMRGNSSKAAKQKASNVLTLLGLSHRLSYKPNVLSGGEQQRVSVARAIVNDVDVLFADEPTASLDTENAKIMLDYFDKIHNKGQTIVMVTHELDYAKRAKRLITLKDGNLISDKMLRKKKRA